MKYSSILTLKKEFRKRFPTSKIELINFTTNNLVKVRDEFGECIYSIQHILHEGTSSIIKAVDKTSYFKKKASSIHDNFYDYSLVDYTKSSEKVNIVCPTHGEFKMLPVKHLQGQGCKECGYINVSIKNTLSNDDFMHKSNIVHGYRYDYSTVDYKNAHSEVSIICKKHGIFNQVASTHLNGHGCPKCKNELTTVRNVENPTGWSYTNWIKAAEKSKRFDSFKVYILECWNENENFYKIGKTFLTVKNRFNCVKLLPYKYKILKIYEGEGQEISELESDLIKINKANKYLPKIKFNGMYECFNKIEKI